MNAKQILAVGIVALFALCLVPSAVDGASISDNPNSATFDNMDGGNITFTVDNRDGPRFVMTVVVTEVGGSFTWTHTENIPSGVSYDVSLDVPFTSEGEHTLRVDCSSDDVSIAPSYFTVNVNVETSLLSNWVTYLVIAIVVIVVVVFAYLKIRDTPKAKPEMTFEELEAQRKAEMAEKAERKQKKAPKAASTERKRYTGSKDDAPKEKPKKESPKSEGLREAPAEKPKKEEKQKPTFEELDAQKKAEKAAKAEKKSSGKSERERYLEEKRKKNKEE